jgi:hypothetical protein
MRHSLNVLVLNILLHVSAFQMPSSGIPIWTCWDGAQCRENQRRMGAVYRDRGRNIRDIAGWRSPLGSFTQQYSAIYIYIYILSTNTLNEWYICWSFTHQNQLVFTVGGIWSWILRDSPTVCVDIVKSDIMSCCQMGHMYNCCSDVSRPLNMRHNSRQQY